MKVKAISIQQPHANEIRTGEKTAEFRGWYIAHRGPLLVVSSARPDPDLVEEARGLPLGQAICVAEITGCEGEDGDWDWLIGRVLPLEPGWLIKGRLGLYPVEWNPRFGAWPAWPTSTVPRGDRPRGPRRGSAGSGGTYVF